MTRRFLTPLRSSRKKIRRLRGQAPCQEQVEDWTCLGQHKRHPEFPDVTRESRPNSRKTTWFPRHRKMKPFPATASQEKSHVHPHSPYQALVQAGSGAPWAAYRTLGPAFPKTCSPSLALHCQDDFTHHTAEHTGKCKLVPCNRVKMIQDSEVKSLSRVQLFASPWTVAYKAPRSMGF